MDEKIKALMVGVNLNDDPDFENALKELESLAEACDMEVVGVETQNVNQINTGVYVGTGRWMRSKRSHTCSPRMWSFLTTHFHRCSFGT